ncbi:MAG: hypothetical protein U0S36_09595 [Candidatus Nanopelagicales bacterium]
MDEHVDDAARPEGDAPGWAADPHADTGPIPVVTASEPTASDPTASDATASEPTGSEPPASEADASEAPAPGSAASGPADPHADTAPIPAVTAAGPEPGAAAAAGEAGGEQAHHTHVLHGHPHVAPPVHHEPPRHAESAPRRVWPVAAAVAALLLVVGGISAYALTRGGDAAVPVAGPTGSAAGVLPGEGGPTPTLTGVQPGSTPPLAAARPTLVLGDSLGLTVYPWLADLLPDRYVSYEAEVGRSTANTLRALEDLTRVPKVVIVSSGTNDQYASDVKAGATRILDALGPNRCVVWVDVVRPDRVGDPQDEVNAAIDAAVAGRTNVRVLRWSEMVAAHPEWLSSDGIHPGQEGAEARAKAFADAALACSPLDPSAPKADRQVLPQSVFNGPISGTGGSGSGGSGTGSSGSGSGSSGSSSTRSPSPSATKKPKPSATPKPTASTKPTPTKTSDPPAPPPATTPPPTPDPSTQA